MLETNFPESLEPMDWVQAYKRDQSGATLSEWFKAAIQAGYDAARPLEPNKVYVGDGEPLDEKEVFDAD